MMQRIGSLLFCGNSKCIPGTPGSLANISVSAKGQGLPQYYSGKGAFQWAWKEVSNTGDVQLSVYVRSLHYRVRPGTDRDSRQMHLIPHSTTAVTQQLKDVQARPLHPPRRLLDGELDKLYLDFQRALHFFKDLEQPSIF